MEAMLIRERYKVIQVLDAREHYAFLQAVDIQDREKQSCFLNLYDGPLLPVYLNCFDRLEGFPDYLRMFSEGDSLAVVFQTAWGSGIDQIFYKGAKHPWRVRMEFAEKLLHTALSLAALPPRLSCPLMLSDNILIDLEEGQLRLRWHLVPMEEMNPRELVYLTVDQLKKILLERFDSPMEELMFLQTLDRGTCLSVVQLYALWKRERESIQAAYEKLEKKNFIKRWFSLVWKNLRYWMKKRKER